jgi:hypothetical protein
MYRDVNVNDLILRDHPAGLLAIRGRCRRQKQRQCSQPPLATFYLAHSDRLADQVSKFSIDENIRKSSGGSSLQGGKD